MISRSTTPSALSTGGLAWRGMGGCTTNDGTCTQKRRHCLLPPNPQCISRPYDSAWSERIPVFSRAYRFAIYDHLSLPRPRRKYRGGVSCLDGWDGMGPENTSLDIMIAAARPAGHGRARRTVQARKKPGGGAKADRITAGAIK